MKKQWYEKWAIYIIVAVIAYNVWHGLEQSAQQQRCEKAAAAGPADQFVTNVLKCH